MSSVCYESDCKYNKPKWQTKKRSRQPLAGGHCKIGRSESIEVSGRCILGLAKRRILCPLKDEEDEEEEEEYPVFEGQAEQITLEQPEDEKSSSIQLQKLFG